MAFSDTSDWVKACPGCQMARNVNKKRNATLHSQPISHAAFQKIQIDHLQLPKSGRKSYILVICDSLTGWCELHATESTTAQEAARKILLWIERHGSFDELVSDRGSCFVSELFKNLSQMLGYGIRLTSSRNPKSNGRCEAKNRLINHQLRCLCPDNQSA